MLETYSLDAVEENWLSDCLVSSLLIYLDQLDAGQEPQQFPQGVDSAYQVILENYPGVIARFKTLVNALAGLDAPQREVVRNAIATQNQLPEVFEGATPCVACKTDLPDIHKLAKSLFEFCFETLSRIKSPGSNSAVRDKQYKTARDNLTKKCCPFCGMERLEPAHPDIPRHDLDHYLAVSKYPFCGANLRNLAPMGDRCNSSYKLALDVIYDDDGNRLECFDPYGDQTASFTIENSVILDHSGQGPTWRVEVVPATRATANWDRLFRIVLRLEESLRTEFSDWLVEIGAYLRRSGFNADVMEELQLGLRSYRDTCFTESLSSIAQLRENIASLFLLELDGKQQDRMHAFLREAFAQ